MYSNPRCPVLSGRITAYQRLRLVLLALSIATTAVAIAKGAKHAKPKPAVATAGGSTAPAVQSPPVPPPTPPSSPLGALPTTAKPQASAASPPPVLSLPSANSVAPTALPAAGATTATPADAANIPAVTILSPVDGGQFSSSEVSLKLAVRLPSGTSLHSIRALVDGRTAAQTRGFGVTSAAPAPTDAQVSHVLTVPVPPRNLVLSVVAEGSSGKSAPTSVRLRWTGSGDNSESAAALQPKLFVLAIGVSEYQRPDLRLRFAAKDARDFAAAFRLQQRLLYRAVETKLLTDEQASKNNILDALEWLQKQTTAKDIAVLFLAGHGVTDPSTGSYYYLPHDADTAAMKRTMLPETDIRSTLAAIPGKVLFFLDSCHSGKVFDSSQLRAASDLSSFIGELSSADSGVVVFAASTGRQSSQEAVAWKNGAFTKAVLEGISGRADYQKTGRVTLNMLDLYISERVKELTDGRQTPTTAKPATIPDFPIAVTRDISNDDVEMVR